VRVTNGKFTKVPISSSSISDEIDTGAVIRTPHPVGLLFPGWTPKWLNPPPLIQIHCNIAAAPYSAVQRDTLDVYLVLEPLLLGIFPRSLLPWLRFLFCVVGMGLVVAPAVSGWFAGLAQAVKQSEEKKGI